MKQLNIHPALAHAWYSALGLFFLACIAHSALDEGLLEQIRVAYGQHSYQRLVDWQQMMQAYQDKPIPVQLDAVNTFFNKIPFLSDRDTWGEDDFWATPLEMLVANGGDCEDYSIAKFFVLKEWGIPEEHLRITYVKSLKRNEAHMVLIYAPPGNKPLVLDNLDKEIKLAEERRDLKPIYSFNGSGLWESKQRAGGQLVGESTRIKPWQALQKRLDAGMSGLTKQPHQAIRGEP